MPLMQFGAFSTRARAAASRSGAEADEDGVEFLASRSSETSTPTFLPVTTVTPEIDDPLDLGVEDFARRAIARNAVARHAAELLAGLVQGDRMALAAQEIGAARPAGPPPTMATLLPVVFSGAGSFELVLDRPVADDIARPS